MGELTALDPHTPRFEGPILLRAGKGKRDEVRAEEGRVGGSLCRGG